eukprot:gene19979-23941_t
MVFFLSVCDFIFSLKYSVTAVLPDSNRFATTGTFPCYLQAGVQQFFGLAGISWSGIISLNLILTARRPFENTSKYTKFYHMWVWGLSTATTALMFVFPKEIGSSGDGTCWIAGSNSLLRLLFFVPLLIYIALSVASLITASVFTKSSSLSDHDRKGMLIRMSSYTVVFILCWIGPVAHRIAQLSGVPDRGSNDPTALALIDAISVSIQGFMNAMNEENIPLIRSLADENTDPQQIATSLRNHILTCCLKGVILSVQDNVDVDPRAKSAALASPAEHLYTESDLFKAELNLQNSTIKSHKFKDYTPKIFSAIRSLSDISPDEYLFSEGKSGSFMCFTPDNKYLIKTITGQESMLLRKKMYRFHEFLSLNRSSYLLRFYGSYKITMPNDHIVYLAIMSNVFSNSDKKVSERYDLKGSKINRGGHSNYDSKSLGLDLDFINTREYLRIPEALKRTVVEQIQRDAEFLTSLNIMDYSLLIGVHPNDQGGRQDDVNEMQGCNMTKIVSADRRETYYIGIIDILQLYDFNKKMERFFKVYIRFMNKEGISAVPPEFYKERFMKRMHQIITTQHASYLSSV